MIKHTQIIKIPGDNVKPGAPLLEELLLKEIFEKNIRTTGYRWTLAIARTGLSTPPYFCDSLMTKCAPEFLNSGTPTFYRESFR